MENIYNQCFCHFYVETSYMKAIRDQQSNKASV